MTSNVAMGPYETEAREFLGERTPGIPESQYLFSLAELVRTREKFAKAIARAQEQQQRGGTCDECHAVVGVTGHFSDCPYIK